MNRHLSRTKKRFVCLYFFLAFVISNFITKDLFSVPQNKTLKDKKDKNNLARKIKDSLLTEKERLAKLGVEKKKDEAGKISYEATGVKATTGELSAGLTGTRATLSDSWRTIKKKSPVGSATMRARDREIMSISNPQEREKQIIKRQKEILLKLQNPKKLSKKLIEEYKNRFVKLGNELESTKSEIAPKSSESASNKDTDELFKKYAVPIKKMISDEREARLDLLKQNQDSLNQGSRINKKNAQKLIKRYERLVIDDKILPDKPGTLEFNPQNIPDTPSTTNPFYSSAQQQPFEVQDKQLDIQRQSDYKQKPTVTLKRSPIEPASALSQQQESSTFSEKKDSSQEFKVFKTEKKLGKEAEKIAQKELKKDFEPQDIETLPIDNVVTKINDWLQKPLPGEDAQQAAPRSAGEKMARIQELKQETRNKLAAIQDPQEKKQLEAKLTELLIQEQTLSTVMRKLSQRYQEKQRDFPLTADVVKKQEDLLQVFYISINNRGDLPVTQKDLDNLEKVIADTEKIWIDSDKSLGEISTMKQVVEPQSYDPNFQALIDRQNLTRSMIDWHKDALIKLRYKHDPEFRKTYDEQWGSAPFEP